MMDLRNVIAAFLVISICPAHNTLATDKPIRRHGNSPKPVDASSRVTFIRIPRDAYSIEQLQEIEAAIVGGTPKFIDAYVQPQDVDRLRSQGIDVQIKSLDYRSLRPRSRGNYHDSITSIEALQALARDYPQLVRFVDVGTSRQGRQIAGVIITADVWATQSRKPALRILGAHHGDEWSSMEVVLEVARVLATSFESDSQIQSLLKAHEIWVVPIVNPDGIEMFQRENSRGVDLNRNYSYEWRDWSGGGPRPFSEPETDSVRAMSMRRSFAQSLTFHSGAAYCGFSWGYKKQPPADKDLMQHMCEIYNAKTDMPDFWVWNTDDWYQTNGDTNDWSYGVRGGLDYTIEVTMRKTPADDKIAQFLNWHVDPTLALLQETRSFGVMGVVSDATTGVPLEAKITLLPDGQPVYADPDFGLFHRLTFSGEQNLRIEAPGYQTQTINVTVSAGTTTQVEVPLASAAPADVSLWHAEPSIIPVDGGSVQVRLHGQGLANWAQSIRLNRWDAETVTLPFKEQNDTLDFTVDPTNLGERYTREGFYWITVVGNTGEVSLPRGLLVTSKTVSGSGLVGVDVANGAGLDGLHRVTINGENLPYGADILLVGPGGQVVVPERIVDESTTQHVAIFDPDRLADGTWDVILYGHARYFGLDDALEIRNGLFIGDDAVDDDPVDDDPINDGSVDDDPVDDDPINDGSVDDSPTGTMGCASSDPGNSDWCVLFALFALFVITHRNNRVPTPSALLLSKIVVLAKDFRDSSARTIRLRMYRAVKKEFHTDR